MLLTYVLCLVVALAPAAALRAALRRPLALWPAVGWACAFHVLSFVLYAVATGHGEGNPLLNMAGIGAFFVLRWQTKRSAAKATAQERKDLGYD